MNCEEAKSLLGGFIDGELAADASQRVREHLETCGDCRRAVEDYRMLSKDLRNFARPEVSSRLRTRVLSALAEERKASTPSAGVAITAGASPQNAMSGARIFSLPRRRFAVDLRQLAATIALCAVTSAATFVATEQYGARNEAESELVAAHMRALLQDNPMQVASSDSHTVRPWFAGRIDFAPEVRDLSAQGYPLIGGRLDVVGGKRVAVAIYKHGLHWINVYMWSAKAGLALPDGMSTRSGYNVLTWKHDDVVYSAVSDSSRSELKKLEGLL